MIIVEWLLGIGAKGNGCLWHLASATQRVNSSVRAAHAKANHFVTVREKRESPVLMIRSTVRRRWSVFKLHPIDTLLDIVPPRMRSARASISGRYSAHVRNIRRRDCTAAA